MKISKYTYATAFLRKFSLCLFVILLYQGLSAQSSSEISVHMKGQFSKLKYDYPGDNDMDNGYAFGINYAYYLNENWSLSTGAEYQKFTSNTSLSDVDGKVRATDQEGENFEFRYSTSRYVEDQEVSFINIPLKVQYETSGPVAFYAAGGVKVGLNLHSSSEYRALNLTTSGYYKQYEAVLNDPKFIGFGDFGTYEGESNFEFDTNYILNLETGIKLDAGYSESLYVGLFIDYGLNDLKKDSLQSGLFEYNSENPTVFRNTGILYAINDNNPFVDEIKTISFGLKIRYGFKI